MKFKNLKYGLSALILAMTLTGCSSDYHVEELESAIESLQDENDELQGKIEELQSLLSQNVVDDHAPVDTEVEIEEIELVDSEKIESDNSEIIEETQVLTDDEIRSLVDEIKSALDSHYYFNYSDYLNRVYIDGFFDSNKDFQISDEVYDKLNLLLQQASVLELKLTDNNLDLSRLDLSHLDKIEISSTNLEFVKTFMKDASSKKIDLTYSGYLSDDAVETINFFVDNNIKLSSLNLYFNDNDQFAQIHDKLSDLNAESIYFNVCNNGNNSDNIFNIKTKLNDSISYIHLDFRELGFNLMDDTNKNAYEATSRFGNIEISSNNPELEIAIDGCAITQDTKFAIDCRELQVGLNNVSYTDVIPFYDLKGRVIIDNYDYENKVYFAYYINWFDNNILVDDTNGDRESYSGDFEDFVNKIEEVKGNSLVIKR